MDLTNKRFLCMGTRPGGLGIATGMALAKQGAIVVHTVSNFDTFEQNKRKGRFSDAELEYLESTRVLACNVKTNIFTFIEHLANEQLTFDGFLYSIAHATRKTMLGTGWENASSEEVAEAFQINVMGFWEMLRSLHDAGLLHNPASALVFSYDSARTYKEYGVMGMLKAGLEKLVQDLAVVYGPQGIHINTISAGPVQTMASSGIPGIKDMVALAAEKAPVGWDPENARQIIAEQACRILGSPVGMTGHNIKIDGGLSLLAIPTS